MKQKTFNNQVFTTLSLVLLSLSLALLTVTLSPKTTQAVVNNCSEVLAPLPIWVNEGVKINKADYLAVSEETNVPWEFLAAIHYRETNFSRANPSNGLGIFQFTPAPREYPVGPVSDAEFRNQLRYMAQKIQDDYVNRTNLSGARKLTKNETSMKLIKDTFFSYNGRATVYANQASTYGYSPTATPYEGSPYVMNMFDCARARMGIITQDYGNIDGKDTRFGAFTLYARLKGDAFWKSLQSDKTGTFRFERLVGQTPAVILSDSKSQANYTKTVTVGEYIHTLHYDDTKQSLIDTYYDGSKWTSTIIDGKGASTPGATTNNVGMYVDAVSYKDGIQAYYYDSTDGSLRHAWKESNTSEWKTETLDGLSQSPSKYGGNVGKRVKVILYGSNSLQLYYYDDDRKAIRHAWWDGTMWKYEKFDGESTALSPSNDDVGQKIEAFTIGKNQIQLFYYNASKQGIRHAWWSNGKWRFEDFDGKDAGVGKRTSDVGRAISASYYQGTIQLFYFDKTNGELVHAWWPKNGPNWRFETMDGDLIPHSVVGNYINAGQQIKQVEFKDRLYVYYYDNAVPFNTDRQSGWRLVYWSNKSWNSLMLDGGYNSLSGSQAWVSGDISATVYKNSMQVFYGDSTRGLRHAWFNE